MLKQERADYVAKTLQKLFPKPPIPLWHNNAFSLLIAVLLSAQCTDKKVNEVTPILFSKGNEPEDLIRQGQNWIREIISPIGFANQKAKNIYNLSHILVDKHQGQVPDNFTDLEALPGVGHKTASVVMSQVFHHPAFPVDTHIHRLGQVWKLTSGKNVEQTEADLKRLFAEELWNDLHLQIIYYGREVCPARKCDGIWCPMCQVLFPKRKTAFKAKKA